MDSVFDLVTNRARLVVDYTVNRQPLPAAAELIPVPELTAEQRRVLKKHGLAWVLFVTPEAQVTVQPRTLQAHGPVFAPACERAAAKLLAN